MMLDFDSTLRELEALEAEHIDVDYSVVDSIELELAEEPVIPN